MPTVYIIIYSLYHHVYKVAKSVQEGLEAEGVTVKLFQVPETLSEDILTKLHAPPKPDIPIITVNDLTSADAFIFGVPTRFGTLPSQMKSFLDATGALWATGGLSGKFVGTFFSTASQHGGQETTAYTLMTYFAHHGLNYIPLGFANANLFDNDEVVGGSPYGSGTVANGDGSREPTEKELDIGRTQGENFAKLLNTYHRGLELVDETTLATTDENTTTTLNNNNTTDATGTTTNDIVPTTTDVVEDKEVNKAEEITPVVGAAAATGAAAAVTTASTTAGGVPVATKADEPKVEDAKVTESINEIQPVEDKNTTTAENTTPAVKKEEVEPPKKKEEVKEKSVEPEKPKPAAAAAKPAAPAAKKEEKSKCFCM